LVLLNASHEAYFSYMYSVLQLNRLRSIQPAGTSIDDPVAEWCFRLACVDTLQMWLNRLGGESWGIKEHGSGWRSWSPLRVRGGVKYTVLTRAWHWIAYNVLCAVKKLAIYTRSLWLVHSSQGTITDVAITNLVEQIRHLFGKRYRTFVFSAWHWCEVNHWSGCMLRAGIVLVASVCTKFRKLLIANWCNLVGICPVMNATGCSKLVTFDLWLWELFFVLFLLQATYFEWLDLANLFSVWRYIFRISRLRSSFKVVSKVQVMAAKNE